jgi:eukaryotic translation initiation factor 2C
VCLKINAKTTYGLNSLPPFEHSPSTPIVSKVSTFILGMDGSHDSPRQSFYTINCSDRQLKTVAIEI